jgi:4-hydroxythreonine-4-phosphate dehydrogenase
VQALQDAARRWPDAQFTVLGDAALLDARAAAVGADRAVLAGGRCRCNIIRSRRPRTRARWTRPTAATCCAARRGDRRRAGRPLRRHRHGAAAKSTINDAGVPFTGHTEYLAERTHTPRVVMMLAGTGERPLRVALATTHLPLKDVSAALTIDGLVDTLRSSIDLRRDFGLARRASS